MPNIDLGAYLKGRSEKYHECIEACVACLVACEMCADASRRCAAACRKMAA